MCSDKTRFINQNKTYYILDQKPESRLSELAGHRQNWLPKNYVSYSKQDNKLASVVISDVMADKEKKKESKKAKGEGEEKDSKPTKEAKDAKSKKDKDSTGPYSSHRSPRLYMQKLVKLLGFQQKKSRLNNLYITN